MDTNIHDTTLEREKEKVKNDGRKGGRKIKERVKDKE